MAERPRARDDVDAVSYVQQAAPQGDHAAQDRAEVLGAERGLHPGLTQAERLLKLAAEHPRDIINERAHESVGLHVLWVGLRPGPL